MEDPEVQKQRQEIVNTRTVAELSEVHGFGDFPIPTTLERLVDKSKRQSRVERYFMMELYEIDSKCDIQLIVFFMNFFLFLQ